MGADATERRLKLKYTSDITYMYEKQKQYVVAMLQCNQPVNTRKLLIDGFVQLGIASDHRMDKRYKEWLKANPEMGFSEVQDAIIFDKRTLPKMFETWMTEPSFSTVHKGNIHGPWLNSAVSKCINAAVFYEEIDKQLKVILCVCFVSFFCFF